MQLSNKVAFVTGGSGDIGGAICRALATAGADVAASYIGHAQGAAATVAAVEAAGRRAAAVQLDQRDPSSIAASVGSVLQQFGRLDILVNNAAWNIGIAFPDIDALTADVWDRELAHRIFAPITPGVS
jgi:3-oxoacyl-[acyl-carrier protein] reductase